MQNKFNDRTVNFGLPEGVTPKQIEIGAVIEVAWLDTENSFCIVYDPSQFLEYHESEPTTEHSVLVLDLQGLSDDITNVSVQQTQIVRVVKSANELRQYVRNATQVSQDAK